MSEDFISGLHDDLVEAMDRYERRSPHGRLAAGRYPQLLRPATLARVAAAAAILVALVAVVLAVARESDVERPAAPQPSPTTAPGVHGGCVPSKWWKAPIVDEPIPQAIASRFAIFRDPPPSGALPRDLPSFPLAKKLYSGALTLRPRLDTGARLRVVLVAADMTDKDLDHDYCAPPPDPIVPAICVAVFLPDGTRPEGTWNHRRDVGAVAGTGPCYAISSEIEPAGAWFGVTGQTVFGLAPDGVDRVTFDRPRGTQGPQSQSLDVTENVFAGEMRWAQHPGGAETRFTP